MEPTKAGEFEDGAGLSRGSRPLGPKDEGMARAAAACRHRPPQPRAPSWPPQTQTEEEEGSRS